MGSMTNFQHERRAATEVVTQFDAVDYGNLPFVRPSPIGNAQMSLSQQRDRWFESASLQRRVRCELARAFRR